MSMKDFHTRFEAEEALEEALDVRDAMYYELEKLNNYIFFLKYYLATGETIDPAFIELPGEDNNDDDDEI